MKNVRLTMVKEISSGVIDFKANRKITTVPAILKEYMQNGVRMYKCEGGKIFIADMYDKNFVTKSLPKVYQKSTK